MATLNLNQAIKSGGLTVSSPNKSTGLTNSAGKAVAVPSVGQGPALNLNQAIKSGGITPVQTSAPQVNGASTSAASSSGGGGGGFNPDTLRSDVLGMFQDWASGSTRDTNGLADQISAAERDNAERSYNDIMSALGVQRGEVSRTAEDQKVQVKKEGELGTQELETKRSGEETKINKEKDQYLNEQQDQRDVLARNWRDMSLETQRIARASGRSDTGFAGEKEAALLMNFNRGLSKMAQTSQAALKDFADAVVETNRYYTDMKNKLQLSITNQLGSIDTWARQQVQSIQAQENTALSDKLSQIRQAMIDANKLKAQTAQSIRDKSLELGTWLAQTQAQYKMAVATAAQNSVASAQQNIKNVTDQMLATQKLLDANLLQPVDMGNGTQALMAKTGAKEDEWANFGYVPTAAIYSSAARQADARSQGSTGGQGSYNQAYSNALSNFGFSNPTSTVAPTSSSVADRIKNAIAAFSK